MVSHELTPLSLDWLTDRSRSVGRVASIISILDFTEAVSRLDVVSWTPSWNSRLPP